MPVQITKKAKAADAQEVVEKVEPVPAGTRPTLQKPMKVGDFSILPDVDVSEVNGKAKFLVHLFKPYWFKVESVADNSMTVKMKSAQGTVFDSALSGALMRNYMVVVGPDDASTPSDEVVVAVRAMVKVAV